MMNSAMIAAISQGVVGRAGDDRPDDGLSTTGLLSVVTDDNLIVNESFDCSGSKEVLYTLAVAVFRPPGVDDRSCTDCSAPLASDS